MLSSDKKYKVAAVGPSELLSGLESLGVVMYEASSAEKAREQIFEIIENTLTDKEPFAIVMVLENFIEALTEDDRKKIFQHALPVLLSIPHLNSLEESGLSKLRELTTRAIGSDIFSD